MRKGDANDGPGVDTAPTIEHGVTAAAPTPQPLDVGKPRGSVADDALGDTAVASRSQTMAATTPSALDLAPVADSMIDTVLLGRYLVTRKVGQGGMGAVYEATHKLINKRVAVKVLLEKYAQKDQVVARLRQEAELASSIGHEHIIDITDFGETNDGRTFVVMEYLEGESLGAHLAREGAIGEQRAIHIAHQVASALGAAHKKGVIHRDVKPDNIFVLSSRKNDFVKVVDFGISKLVRPGEDEGGSSPRLTQTGMVLGTPLYMSPEQARGDENLDHRIDIYALGVILYEMVTGEVPFRGTNYLSILTQVINDQPSPPRDLRPEISEDLESVIMKAMAKDRDHRYQSMEELADDLAILRTVDGQTTGAKITASRFRRRWQQRSGLRILAWVAGLAVVVAAVVVAVVVMLSSKQERPAPIAAAAAIDAGARAVEPPDAGIARPAVDIAEIELVSTPSGATIYDGDRVVGQTPCFYRMEKANRTVELIAELDGYNDARVTINPVVDTDSQIQVRLKKPQKGTKATKLRRDRKPPDQPPATDTPPVKPDDTAGGDLSGNPYKNQPAP
jgi:serine/threonine-protein kinase